MGGLAVKVAVLLSGGVDSSVSLRLLQQQGYEVEAFYLKIWLEDELTRISTTGCPWQEDLDYARAVCEQAGVKLHIVPMQTQYYKQVVEHCLSEIKLGRTPNPDVFCNTRIKFGAFLQYLVSGDGEDFDKIASGHYAKTTIKDNKTHLVATPDKVKDQTYFLAHLKSDILEKLLFPVGGLFKSQVRDMALRMELANATRKDSQGICFLGKFKYEDFLEHYFGKKPGALIDMTYSCAVSGVGGSVVGEHQGHWFYTIGQRHGIRLSGGPYYVTGKDIESNTVFISRSFLTQEKSRKTFTIENCNWFSWAAKGKLEVKVRHGPNRHKCQVEGARVVLEEPDRGLSPGQFAVFYDGDLCLGSGVIA